MRSERREQLCDLMERHGLGGIVLRRPANFAWYTGGGDSRVDRSQPWGVADVLVTPFAEIVATTTIEAPRMREEQTPELRVEEHPWQLDGDAFLHELAGGAPLGADAPVEGAARIDDDIARLRRVLDEQAIERLRLIGVDASDALAEAATTVVPGIDELELAANLDAACRRRGLTAPVLLAACDRRIERHRHALPFGGEVERRAMLVVSAERGGLFANSTLFVELDERPPELERRARACEEILARMREEATRPGRTLADAFEDCTRFYAEAGYPGEWRLHHQGGSCGYLSREVIATPSTLDRIEVGNAFAWNPSITGYKSEETFVLTESGPEIVTFAPGAAPAAARQSPAPAS
jgi:Xaa-Pro dipeptidase